ncbi:prolyl oligopeptidase family serine peptidase [Peristeroidobacter soli]|uniref:prolyl oligopeptidase family serine peptidase n=1 Tax=Peristeroidobacter soli TaxID=2497877 RepID=UPI001C37DB8D|nr:prolyl oligopeptidase family serine peptidase [Peristeroidobacter soli]
MQLSIDLRALRSGVTRRAAMTILGIGCALSCTVMASAAGTPTPDDENLWLEDITGQRALEWVKEQNAATEQELKAHPEFPAVFARLQSIGNSSERIPAVELIGAHLYNYWRDASHPKGLWRRTSLAEYRKASPQWDAVLDLDALAALESENWVWNSARCLPGGGDRCLVQLSRGGTDAVVSREFDLSTRTFVRDGFALPEAKSHVEWRDRDTLFVATDIGPGSLTDSGYPRIVKRWRRGTPLSAAEIVLEASTAEVRAFAYRTFWPGFEREFAVQSLTLSHSKLFTNTAQGWRQLALPLDAITEQYQDQLLIQLRTEWQVAGERFPAGALLAVNLDAFMKGEPRFEVLFTPAPRSALTEFAMTRDHVVLRELENLSNRLYVLSREQGQWQRHRLPVPEFGELWLAALDPFSSNEFFVSHSGFLQPGSLQLGNAERMSLEPLKQLPDFFSTDGLEIGQFEAVSADGTHVPYFQVSRRGLKLDGRNPTLIYAYGGFGITQLPDYDANIGAAWLERGGVYVLANIRGGAEFGPAWHERATKQHKQRSYDDLISVAENLVRRNVTSPPHLGVMGVSNGGLLAGVMLTQRPDLFGAIVSRVPLLDMRRYHRLLAGASWMSEYGNPDEPQDWRYISQYSPYQNLRRQTRYPRTLLITSTRDDRVHPAHARKMAARMESQGHRVLYYENTEGGHMGAADNRQRAYMNALTYVFLFDELSRGRRQSSE